MIREVTRRSCAKHLEEKYKSSYSFDSLRGLLLVKQNPSGIGCDGKLGAVVAVRA